MTYCSKCGTKMGKDDVCPKCGAGPSQSVVNKGVSKMAVFTGEVLEKTVQVSENVYRGVMPSLVPAAKKAADLTKKGLTKARDETRKAAQNLKDEDK